MEDLSEALERLAALKDRGVLTQEEFDHQKALLLNPPVPHADVPPPPPPIVPAAPAATYVAPPPSGGNNMLIFVIGGIVVLVAIAAALWATGVLAPLGLKGPSSAGTASTAFNPLGTGSNTTMVPGAVPTAAPLAVPTAAPTYTPPYPAAATADTNPVLGSWTSESSNEACPQTVTFTDTLLTMVGTKDGAPQTKQAVVTYNVQGNTVSVTDTGNSHTTVSASVTDGQMVLDGCTYRRN